MRGEGIAEQPSGEKLIPALLLEAAYRMEDSAPLLVWSWSADRDDQAVRIAILTGVAGELAALASAASVPHRVYGELGTGGS